MCQGLDGLEGERDGGWRMGRGDMLETGCLKEVENNALNGDERILEQSLCLASLSLHGVNKAIV
jgi:hypothetical protein